MLPSERLAAAHIVLPEPVAPIGSYLPAKQAGQQIHTSGQLPIDAGGRLVAGRLGAGLQVAAGQRAARIAALNAVAAAAGVAGHVDEIKQVLRVTVFVNSVPGFTDQPQVADGASDVLFEIFGEDGRHVRSAVGVAALPRDAAVEVELIVGI